MFISFVNSGINIINTLAHISEGTAMSSSTASCESSTPPVSPKMAADSGHVSENDSARDDSMSSRFFIHILTCTNSQPAKQQIQVARDSINDNRIPVTGLQLSVFFDVALFTYALDSERLLILLTVLVVLLAVFCLFVDAPLDFAGFRFVSISSSTVVYKEKIQYVPFEKHFKCYIVNEKQITHYNVKGKDVTHYNVKDTINDDGNNKTIKQAAKPRLGSAVLLIASKYSKQVHARADLMQWNINTISLSPYEDVKPTKRAIMAQWLDEFSKLDPVRDLLTSKPRTKQYSRRGCTSARDIQCPLSIPTVFNTILEEVRTWNETSEPFSFPFPHPDSLAASEMYNNGKYIFIDFAPPEIRAQGYDTRWMETAKLNVFLDVWVPGRWAIRTETAY
jgi:hypothetical protein